MELDASQIVLLSDVVHDQLERARRRLKKLPKKGRLAQNLLIDQLGRLQQRIDEERMIEVDLQATRLVGRLAEAGRHQEEADPVPPAA